MHEKAWHERFIGDRPWCVHQSVCLARQKPGGCCVFLRGIRPDPGENAVGDGCPVRDGLCTTDDFFYKIYRIDNDGDGHGSCFEKMAAGRADTRWLCVV